ncbi:MAG: hypothetical protein HC819_13475 [Cyclobacteriaceae bacterium]|nr:hypothetical protein [Cyclobacteriaceae bacterium]
MIGSHHGRQPGPNLIFFAGIHGNEPAGIYALKHILDRLQSDAGSFRGNMYAIAGNIKALKGGSRYIHKDLNRIWYPNSIIPPSERNYVAEYREKIDILKLLVSILDNGQPTYIFDLHTTSSHSMPFISISDTLKNRRIIKSIPVHLILGLEELLDGPMFSFFSEMGLPAILFEAGQHQAMSSVENHVAFIWTMLAKLKCISKKRIPGNNDPFTLLKNIPRGQ